MAIAKHDASKFNAYIPSNIEYEVSFTDAAGNEIKTKAFRTDERESYRSFNSETLEVLYFECKPKKVLLTGL